MTDPDKSLEQLKVEMEGARDARDASYAACALTRQLRRDFVDDTARKTTHYTPCDAARAAAHAAHAANDAYTAALGAYEKARDAQENS